MESKICTSCNQQLPVSSFYRDRTPIHTISYRSKCKTCSKVQQKERVKHDQDILLSKICSVCNTEKQIDQYYKSYRHKDGYFKWCNKCHEIKSKNKGNNNKIKRTPEYMINYNNKRKDDVIYQLKYTIRSNLHSYLKRDIKCCKKNTTLQYIGCSLEFMKKWFEFNFDDTMNWKNRGSYWHIDHITPCDSYDLTQQEEIYKCYHWTNLRPLEKYENISKSNKIDSKIITKYEAKVKIFLNQINYELQDNRYELLPEVKALPVIESQEPGELTGNS